MAADSEIVLLGAAKSTLELWIKIRETVELTQRIAAFEARAAASENKE
jgi:hypothetical protein